MTDAAALWQLPSVLPSASPRACSWVAAVGIGIHRAGKVRHASAQQEAETDDSGQDGNVEGGSNEAMKAATTTTAEVATTAPVRTMGRGVG